MAMPAIPLEADGAESELTPRPRNAILIVDDNAVNRRILTGVLRGEPRELLCAANGIEAVRLARENLPQLLLLDVTMPGMDGYAVCAELRADPRTRHLPVILLSALSAPADKIRGLELGAVDFITKPFDRGEVLARVRNQLEMQRLANELRSANRSLEQRQALLDEDLEAAAAIQRRLMPASLPDVDNVHIAWRFMSCERVGGDLLDVRDLGGSHLALAVVDVGGRGVPAAMVTVSLSQFLSPQMGNVVCGDGAVASPAEVLRRLDAEYPMERLGRHFAVAYALLDHRSGRLRYGLAGHRQPLLVSAAGGIDPLGAASTIIDGGALEPFEEGEVRMQPGDRVFLYSDGVVELASADGEKFGEQRLREVLLASRGRSLEVACDAVLRALGEFSGACGPQDDVTLLAAEYVDGVSATSR